MRKLKTILVACLVASSLFGAAGTAWASTAAPERGTSWTELEDWYVWSDPGGVSWEMLDF
ncbi:MAG: hypothetical protein ACRDG6_06595 [Candidatus Limnocylindria bacterium]